jgi:hypothetical protein
VGLELQAAGDGLRVERKGPTLNEWSDLQHYKLTAPGPGKSLMAVCFTEHLLAGPDRVTIAGYYTSLRI